MNDKEKAAAALAQVRAVYEDSEAEINGRKYRFQKMQHVERRKVFAFYTSIQRQLRVEDFSFLDTPQFAAVEEVMHKAITFDGHLLTKLRDHWDEVPEDYIQLTTVALSVISYPFLRAAHIASPSDSETQGQTSSSKPM